MFAKNHKYLPHKSVDCIRDGINMKCCHSCPQFLMGSDKRPGDVSIFPEGMHRISYACSLCFHISGDDKEESCRLNVHVFSLNDVNSLQPLRNIL